MGDACLISRFVILSGILHLIVGCSSDIDILTKNSQTTPCVICMMNPWDSVHSIRLQRSFLIRDKEGAQLKDPDSIYFQEADVWITGILNGEEKFSYNFEKTFVDKDSGDFTGEGHHVYRLNQKLPINLDGKDRFSPGRPDIEYLSFSIYIHDLDTLIQHKIPVYSPILVTSTPSTKKVCMYGYETTQFYGKYKSLIGNSQLSAGEIVYRFHISEYGEGFGYDTVYYHEGLSDLRKPELLFNKIMMSVDITDDRIRTRVFHKMDVLWTRTDLALSEFTKVNSSWVGMLDYPLCQIPGVFGFISPKIYGELNDLVLDNRSLDSLCYGQKWKHLKFKHW